MTSITRKEYNAEGTQTSALGMPCTTKTEEFDGSVSVGGVSIDDAFDVNEIEITDGHSTGVMALAARVAEVKLQPRLIPHAFSAPKVNGFVCTKNATLQDGVWLDCGTTQTDATPQTVCALNASDDAVKALMQEVSEVLGIPCASLWQIGDTSGVVSIFGSGYTDGEALMDGRSTMVGYPVSGATDMVWTALGSAQLMALNASSTQKNGKSLLCRLLTMLGMPETMAQQEQAALSGGRLAVPTVSADGEIELKNDDDTNPLIVGTEAKSRLLYRNGTSNAPWISVNAGGASMLLWPDNKGDVFALLAGMARKAMNGIVGVGLVGVGVNGGCSYIIAKLVHDGYSYKLLNLWFNVYRDDLVKAASRKTYMSFDKASYFASDIVIKTTYRVVIEFSETLNNSTQFIFGVRSGTNPSRFEARIEYNSSTAPTHRFRAYCGAGESAVTDACSLELNQKYAAEVSYTQAKLAADGGDYVVLRTSTSTAIADNTNPLFIGARNYDGTRNGNMFYGNIYSFKVFDGDVLKHDVVALRNNLFIDLMTGNTFTNQGTGTASIVSIE